MAKKYYITTVRLDKESQAILDGLIGSKSFKIREAIKLLPKINPKKL